MKTDDISDLSDLTGRSTPSKSKKAAELVLLFRDGFDPELGTIQLQIARLSEQSGISSSMLS